MAHSNAYPHEERARVRTAVRTLAKLEEEQRACLERGIILPVTSEEQIRRLTNTDEANARITALSTMGEQLQHQHLEKLYPLAANEFNAFCEVMEPNEPPESPWHVFLTDTLQRIEGDPKLGRFILNCPPGHAKPLWVGTPVLMGDGTWKRLGDIEIGDYVVSDTGTPRKVTAVHQQGTQPLLKIETHQGRVVLSEPTHSFRVGSTWKQAGDLRPGDPLEIIGESNQHPYREVPDTLIDIAAIWMAYGTTAIIRRKTGTEILSPKVWFPEARVEAILDAFEAHGIKAPCHPVRGTGGYTVSIAPTHHPDLVEKLGMATPAEHRRLPAFIETAPAEQVVRFLSRFISERAECPKRYKQPHLVCFMRSADLARDLQRLCARIGVFPTIERPAPRMGGRPSLVFGPAAIAALKFAGVSYDGTNPERIEPVGGCAQDPTDHVFRVTPAGEGECRCLTVEVDHTFTAEGIVVHNSTYASRLYVVWRMGRNPNLQVIGGGHSQTFVENEFSYKNRTLLRLPSFQRIFPGISIDPNKSAKGQWALAGYKGQYVAKGVGQGVHGFRAHFVVVDDPYSKVEDAESATVREKVRTWFLTDIGTRLLPGGKVFVIMTRFHEDDLTGTLLELNKEYPPEKRYTLVEAPAICYDPENDILGRRLGEVLWDFYSLSDFVDKRVGQKYQRFALIYQQLADAASEDSITGSFKYYKRAPHLTDSALEQAREQGFVNPDTGRVIPQIRAHFRKIIVSVDTATKDTNRADYTVVQVWGQTQQYHNYLLDQSRQKVEFNDLISLIEKVAKRWGADVILVEDKGNGSAYIQARGATNSQRRLAPCPIVAVKTPPNQGKTFRFDEVTPLIEAGEVHLPEEAPWIELFIREVGQFPEGNHDDQVDAMSQALRYLKTTKSRYGSKKVASMG